jgi:hypothetical protein
MSPSFFLPEREVLKRRPERLEGSATNQEAFDGINAQHINSPAAERRDS